MLYYYLDTRLEIDDLQDRQSIAETMQSGDVCGTCHHALGSNPIDIVFRRAPKGIIQPAFFAQVVHAGVFQHIEPHLRGHRVGRCYVRRKSEPQALENYISCHTTREESVRCHGFEDARFTWCPDCQWISLAYAGKAEYEGATSYLVESELAGLRDAYQEGSNGGLFLSERLVAAIPWKEFPPAELLPVEVRQQAMDINRMPGGSDECVYVWKR